MNTNDPPMTREQLLELLKAVYMTGYRNANERHNQDGNVSASEAWTDNVEYRMSPEFRESWPFDPMKADDWWSL